MTKCVLFGSTIAQKFKFVSVHLFSNVSRDSFANSNIK